MSNIAYEIIELIEKGATLVKGASFLRESLMFNPLGEEVAPYGECAFIANTSDKDDDNDVIYPSGVKITNNITDIPYLWVHDPAFVLGRAENMVKGTSNGKDALFLQLSYAPSSEAQEKRKMVETGYIRTGSVRVSPVQFKPNRDGGLDVTSCTLREFSLHPLPRNSNAKIVYSKGGEYDKGLRDLLKNIRRQAIAQVVSRYVDEYFNKK